MPGEELAFEWIPFVSRAIPGKEGPPLASPAQRNPSPLPTWVELKFSQNPGEPGKTHLRVAHYGFGVGERWEESFRWFSHVWKAVLDQLVRYCENQPEHRKEKP